MGEIAESVRDTGDLAHCHRGNAESGLGTLQIFGFDLVGQHKLLKRLALEIIPHPELTGGLFARDLEVQRVLPGSSAGAVNADIHLGVKAPAFEALFKRAVDGDFLRSESAVFDKVWLINDFETFGKFGNIGQIGTAVGDGNTSRHDLEVAFPEDFHNFLHIGGVFGAVLPAEAEFIVHQVNGVVPGFFRTVGNLFDDTDILRLQQIGAKVKAALLENFSCGTDPANQHKADNNFFHLFIL